MPTEKKLTKATLNAKQPRAKVANYNCVRCNQSLPESSYFMAKNSKVWIQYNGRVPLCQVCCDEIYNELIEDYSPMESIAIITHYLDLPFIAKIAQNTIESSSGSSPVSRYVHMLSLPQYKTSTYIQYLLSGEIFKSDSEVKESRQNLWSADEIANKNNVLDMLGYDPFSDFTDADRKYLFSELVKYLDGEDEILNDPYKLSQIIQIVINNGQIHKCDVEISKLKPSKNADSIQQLNEIKKALVSSNDRIAKENEISVKNRSNKEVGKNTLTFLMRDLRKKNFKQAEANYYDQLKSAGTQWALDISNKSIMQNTFFDENDRNDIMTTQRNLIQDLQQRADDQEEQIRQLKIELAEAKKKRES